MATRRPADQQVRATTNADAAASSMGARNDATITNRAGMILAAAATPEDLLRRVDLAGDDRVHLDARERFSEALAMARMAFWTWDPESDRMDTSPSMADVFGLRPGEQLATGAQALALVHAADREMHRSRGVRARTEGRGWHLEFRVIRPCDGGVAWLEERTRVTTDPVTGRPRVTGLVWDITERKLAVEAVRESAELLSIATRAARLYAWEIDLVTRTLRASQGAADIVGFDPSGPLDRDSEWYHPGDVERTAREFEAAIARGGRFELEYRVIHPLSRREISFRAEGIVELDPAGRAVRAVGITRDVTEQHELEVQREELLEQERAAREEAEAATRLRDEFLASVSHELRTPLAAVLLWARLLQTGQLPGREREAIDTIVRNAGAQNALIEDLLDASRLNAGAITLERADVEVGGVVAQAVDAVRPLAEAGEIELEVVLGARAVCWVDAGRLAQVVRNLLDNALRYSRPGSRVTVTVDRADDQAVITVADTGRGIQPDLLPHVFDRFRRGGTGGRHQGGLGLGLSIARELVAVHGGSIDAASPGPGRGATFTVHLPLGGCREP